ncbi:MAG: response regulator [Proteobacteria bacterium]|nr:response regulator [Pseudomonadota bacterium]
MKPMRILVVDDDRDFAESMGDLITLEGHQPILAYNGIEALEIFKQNNIDLILIDYMMPGLNGIETLSEIRKLNSAVPVVMITAFSNSKLVKEATCQGAIEVLDKPFDINKLTKIFSRIKHFYNILLLDDDKDFADSMSTALLDEGFKVTVAYNTKQALDCISKSEIQILILDIRINGKTGIDFWYSIREVHPNLPTIFISGYTDQFFDQIEKIMKLTKIEVMNKPFAPSELISTIRHLNVA